jgi:hypothetical protein
MDKEERKLKIFEIIKEEAMRDLEKYRPIMSEVGKIAEKMTKTVEPTLKMYSHLSETMKPIIEEINKRVEMIKPFNQEIEPLYIPSRDNEPEPIRNTLTEEDTSEIARKVFVLMSDKKDNKTNSSFYPLPENAKLENLRMKFFDGHTVKIYYPGLPIRTFDYKDMGFRDNKTQNPNTCWSFLLEIAENGGSFTVQKYDARFNRNIKYETSEKLKKFFQIKTAPFYPYKKEYGYKPVFAILGERDNHPIEG